MTARIGMKPRLGVHIVIRKQQASQATVAGGARAYAQAKAAGSSYEVTLCGRPRGLGDIDISAASREPAWAVCSVCLAAFKAQQEEQALAKPEPCGSCFACSVDPAECRGVAVAPSIDAQAQAEADELADCVAFHAERGIEAGRLL